MTIRYLSAVILGGVSLACATALSAQNAVPAGDVLQGHRIYMAVGCWECHGSVGQGGGTAGPQLAATAWPYVLFLRQLRVPRREMPPYEAQILSDSDVANIYAYLRSIPPSKPAGDIPLLNALK